MKFLRLPWVDRLITVSEVTGAWRSGVTITVEIRNSIPIRNEFESIEEAVFAFNEIANQLTK
jgi:hypothetical protein